jgi:hypothetical protein
MMVSALRSSPAVFAAGYYTGLEGAAEMIEPDGSLHAYW